jgi:putative solute:sodium symporter small subunit
MSENSSNNEYWAANMRIIKISLVIWALVSFGFGILLRPLLSGIAVGGTDLGFWFAQQGSILVFLGLIFFLRLAHESSIARARRGRRIGAGLRYGSVYINLLFVGGSFALYIGIAIWARAGSTSEFYAAGRGVHPVTNGMATAADWMSAASFISMAGLIAFTGYDNSSFLMGWTGGYVLLAMLLAPYLRKFGKFTVSEFIGDRFYSQTPRAYRGR